MTPHFFKKAGDAINEFKNENNLTNKDITMLWFYLGQMTLLK